MERTIKRVEFVAPRRIDVLRVAAYARVSTGKDAMLHSLSAQVSYYSNLIQKHPGWLYCGVYADEALTGTKDNRDNFQRLLEACRAGEIDMVITKSISRFARNTVALLESIRELKELGVDVFFEEQNIHTMSSDGELMLTILASYAQEESRSASENQKWRVRKGFEKGELLNWRIVLGYDIGKDGIKAKFLEAYNHLLPDREHLIEDCRVIQAELTDCADIDREMQQLLEELEVVAELTKRCVDENSSTALDQGDYLARYNGLVERYENAQVRVKELERKRTERMAKADAIGGFMFRLRELEQPLEHFDERLWLDVIDRVVVHRDGLTFKFQNGKEIRV